MRATVSAQVESLLEGELMAGVESALARPALDAGSILEGLAADSEGFLD